MFAASKTAAAAAGTPPPSTDPQFNYVTMLLHGDGTNGAQNNTFVDSSTNNFTITRNGTPTQGSFSPYGTLWSNQFNGSTSYITGSVSSSLELTGDFTIEMWINGSATRGVYPVLLARNAAYTAANNVYICYRHTNSSNVFSLHRNPSSPLLIGTTTLTDGVWYHLAISRSGSTVRMFVNGVLQSNTLTDSSTWNYSAPTIGSNPSDGGATVAQLAFGGNISNLRIVKGTTLYTANFTPSTTPLTAVSGTSLLTCQSNRFIDNSSNNFAITVTGTPSVQRFSPFDPAAEYSTSVIGGSGFFSGSGQYLSFTGTNAAFEFGTGDWTIETWVYATTIQAQRICDFRPGPGNGPYVTIGMNGSGQFDYTSQAAIRITGTTVAKPNTWFHVSVCRSGTSTRLFINGVQEGSTYSDSTVYIVASGRPFIAADSFSPGTGVWAGYLSNFRMLKGTALYTAAFTPPTAPLTAITNTSLLLNTVNAGIFDNAMMNDLVTVGNAQVSTAVKKYGTGSMAFDGTGDWLAAPSTENIVFGAGNFTLEGWVYITSSATAEQFFWGKRANNAAFSPLLAGFSRSGSVYRIYYLGSFNGSSWGLNSSFTRGTIDIPLNTWVHIAVVRNGSTFTGYVNGVADLTFTGLSSALMTNTDNQIVGASSTAGDAPMTGYIDDLRITKGIARYTTTFTPPTAAFPNN